MLVMPHIYLVRVGEHLPALPLPPLGNNIVIVPPQQPLIPGQPGSDHFSADDHSVVTTPHSVNNNVSADDASVAPSSRRSPRHSP